MQCPVKSNAVVGIKKVFAAVFFMLKRFRSLFERKEQKPQVQVARPVSVSLAEIKRAYEAFKPDFVTRTLFSGRQIPNVIQTYEGRAELLERAMRALSEKTNLSDIEQKKLDAMLSQRARMKLAGAKTPEEKKAVYDTEFASVQLRIGTLKRLMSAQTMEEFNEILVEMLKTQS